MYFNGILNWTLKLLLMWSLLAVMESTAQEGGGQVDIVTVPVAQGLYMLQGAGGNIGVFIGSDGVFMIDDQYAPMTEKIKVAIRNLTKQSVKFLVNTHWHSGHTEGNTNMKQAGAVIIAHEKVRERLLYGGEIKALNHVVAPAPIAALPVITFSENVTFYWNGDTLNIEHIGPAHTDGDSVIYFKKANVVHTGDLYFNGFYPFIDASSGGSVAGMVEAIENILSRTDESTKIIPGHGSLSDKKELEAYRQMLATVHTRIRSLKNKGKTLDEIVAAKPTADFDEKWGKGLLAPDKWVEVVYSSL